MRRLTTFSLQLAMAVTATVWAGPASAQGVALLPGDAAWVLTEASEVARLDGRDVIRIRAGRALRPDIRFADGTVEFEMRTREVRSFVGITFRGRGTEPHEDIYLRTHKSGLPDAIQYTPRFDGQGQWQLYHGPHATGFANFTPGDWQRVRLVVEGDRAAVFVGDTSEPQLVVDELRSDVREGALGFWATQPGAGPDDPWAVLLSNIVVRPGEVGWDFPPVEPEPSPEGVIREWALSETFVRHREDVLELPAAVATGPWRAIATEPSGLLPIERHVQRPDDGTPAVLARLDLEADRARTVRLDLGFSDRASVFLNGRLVYSGRHDFSDNFPRRQGLITLDQAALHLPLEPGRNRVVVAVSETFGGWGLMGRIADRVGVEVRAGGIPEPSGPATSGGGSTVPMEIARLEAPIDLDGTPDEAAWQAVEPLPLTMYFPTFRGEPEQRTVIRVAHEDEHFYAAGWFYDDDREGIRVNSLYRDRWNGDDAFAIYIDAFDDNQNAKWFGTTPGGIRFDQLVSDDGQTINGSWDTFWDAETTVTEEGWFAEVRIPFSSLGFQVDGEGRAVMGLTVTRLVSRTSERVTFPAIEPRFLFRQPSVARTVVLEDVRSPRPIYVTPYALARADREPVEDGSPAGFHHDTDRSGDLGLDLRYALSGSLTLDVTVNTDFAQVEADDEQVNLDRFSLFFPDKRRFFQERSGIFDFTTGAGSRLFHSRRIGLTDDRRPVPVLGGARLVGRLGEWDVGALGMRTDDLSATPGQSFGVARVRRRVFNPYSSVGAMATARGGGDGRNLAWGLDGTLRTAGDHYLTLKWTATEDEEVDGADLLDRGHLNARLRRRVVDGLAYTLEAVRSGRAYNPAVGFLPRRDFTQANVLANWYHLTDEHPLFRRVWPGMLAFSTVRNEDGSLESGQYAIWFQWETKGGSGGWIEPKLFVEDVRRPFSIGGEVDVPVGRHVYADLQLNVRMPAGERLRTGLDFRAGTFFDGTRQQLIVSPTWNVSPHLEIGGEYQFTSLQFDDRDQRTDIHLGRLRVRTALDSRASGNAFVQYNSTTDRLDFNVRLRYNFAEGTDLWLVYNEGLATDLAEAPAEVRSPLSLSRTLVLKYSYTFRL